MGITAAKMAPIEHQVMSERKGDTGAVLGISIATPRNTHRYPEGVKRRKLSQLNAPRALDNKRSVRTLVQWRQSLYRRRWACGISKYRLNLTVNLHTHRVCPRIRHPRDRCGWSTTEDVCTWPTAINFTHVWWYMAMCNGNYAPYRSLLMYALAYFWD